MKNLKNYSELRDEIESIKDNFWRRVICPELESYEINRQTNSCSHWEWDEVDWMVRLPSYEINFSYSQNKCGWGLEFYIDWIKNIIPFFEEEHSEKDIFISKS